MLMVLRSRSCKLWALGVGCLGLLVVLGAGCSSHPENSPVVRKKFKELAEMQDQVGNLAVQVKQMSAEMAAVRKDVGDVVALNGGGEAVAKIDQIDTRMQTVEQELTKIREAMTAGSKSLQVASADSAPAAGGDEEQKSSSSTRSSSPSRSTTSRSSVSSEPSAASSGLGRSSSSASSSKSSSSAPAPRPAPKTTVPSKPRGKYYTIQSGDSPATIAKAHGISVNTLLKANRLPNDATVFPGQKLYVPGSN